MWKVVADQLFMQSTLYSKYYDHGQLLSYHCLFNMVIGHRGVGKTFKFKKWCIEDFIKEGKQFVWVRRYKDETKKLRTFFDDLVKAGYFLDHELAVRGDKSFGTFIVDGKIAGYYITLSTSATLKSVPFPDVDKIVFDEFLIKSGAIHYLSDEVTTFLELVSTIFRDRDNVRGAYLIANNISMSNPYFMYFGILPFKQRFYRKGEVLVENYKNQIYIDNIKETRWGKLIAGTQYYDYAVENQSLTDSDVFLEKRSDNSKFKFSIVYKSNIVGFWVDKDEGVMYATREHDPSSPARYCLTREDHGPNLYLIKNIRNTHINDLVFFFDNGLLRFSDNQVKNICYDILSLFRK